MRAPKPDKEDPAVVAARETEQRRAEASRTAETQALLIGATQRRLRRTGRLGGSGGSVPLIAPVSSGAMAAGITGGGSFGGGFGGGSASSGGADRVLSDTVLY